MKNRNRPDDSPARFNVQFLEDAKDFLMELDKDVRREVLENVTAATKTVNVMLFKKLRGTEIWEFRARVKGLQYRLLSFWDAKTKSMVIVTHGFVKKKQKTPDKEIKKAERIRKDYLNKI
ncbi:MAG: type II toxin-antitoxin system RelE/ParE family toxin [Prevotella sp.]|nr:type II toxin-antitoxin system RelE/ParE family toxin [Candidatus Prevotella equi]